MRSIGNHILIDHLTKSLFKSIKDNSKINTYAQNDVIKVSSVGSADYQNV